MYSRGKSSLFLTFFWLFLGLVFALIIIFSFSISSNDKVINKRYGDVFTVIEEADNFNISVKNNVTKYLYQNETKVIYMLIGENFMPLISENGSFYTYDIEDKTFIEIDRPNGDSFAALLSTPSQTF